MMKHCKQFVALLALIALTYAYASCSSDDDSTEMAREAVGHVERMEGVMVQEPHNGKWHIMVATPQYRPESMSKYHVSLYYPVNLASRYKVNGLRVVFSGDSFTDSRLKELYDGITDYFYMEVDAIESVADTAPLSFDFYKDAEDELVGKDGLPEWLLSRVSSLESFSIMHWGTVKVFRGIWRGRVVYVIYNSYTSCQMCEMYYDDGENINWDKEDYVEFMNESTGWKCIYIVFDYSRRSTGK